SGLSMNDVQRVRPTIQKDLFPILVRFRQYNSVLSSDIEKIYWQILGPMKDASGSVASKARQTHIHISIKYCNIWNSISSYLSNTGAT
ncbi:unnamed protein product, partial [Heterotrigona itama]